MKNQELTISIVSPSKPLYEGKVNSVILPLYDGLAGFLKNHAEMIAELGPGKLYVKNSEEEIIFFINGGFVEVSKNQITVLANEAYRKDELNKNIVENEYQEIQNIKARGDHQIEEKLHKLQAIRSKLSFLKEK